MEKLFNEKVNRKNTDTLKWDYQFNEDCIPLWIADSDYKTAPVVLDELRSLSDFGVYGYNRVPKRFNEAVVSWYKKRYDANVKEEWVIPSTGVILEMRILLDVITKEGDGIIIQTPVYHCFHQLIETMNRKTIENKLIRKDDTYIMDFDNLEKLFKEGYKTMILCSPHNPVGRIWDDEELSKIIELAKKYNVFLIVDEIHSDLNIFGKKFISVIDYVNKYDNFVICNAPSKTFNLAGLYTSYIIIPKPELIDLFNNQVKREFLNSPTVFGYSATIKAYEEGEEWVKAQNEHIKNNYLYLKKYINENLPKAVVTKLEGTYLVWIDLSYLNLNTNQLLNICNENGVTCNGGVNFCKDYESFLRINLACPLNQLKEGLARFVNGFKNL